MLHFPYSVLPSIGSTKLFAALRSFGDDETDSDDVLCVNRGMLQKCVKLSKVSRLLLHRYILQIMYSKIDTSFNLLIQKYK